MGNEKIRNWYTGEIIIPAGKYENVREAVEKNGASLDRASLDGASLNRASLVGK